MSVITVSPEVEKKMDEILVATRNADVIHRQDYFHGISYRIECMKHTQRTGGMWMEFGVWQGRSIQHFAEMKPNESFYGFDCFSGLPEKWDDQNEKGKFDVGGKIPEMAVTGDNAFVPWAKNIKLYNGLFEHTLPEFLNTNSGTVDFLHLDADIYSSTRTVFNLLTPRITNGTMIMFDELCDYQDYRLHEIKAFAEFLIETKHKYHCAVYQPSTYSQACFIID
jgi:hypothetical protein